MPLEPCFHKLLKTEDFGLVQANGFKASKPAERHWLGEGVYFFLDPRGYYWAKKWPCNDYSERTDSPEGIVHSTLITDMSLDFRDDEIRNRTRDIVNKLKLRLKFGGLPHSDGAAFAYIFREAIFKELVRFVPTAIIANFDIKYEKYRILGSGVFLTVDEMKIGDTAQIQACVIDTSVVGKLALYKAT